jgi:hypothetical protein
MHEPMNVKLMVNFSLLSLIVSPGVVIYLGIPRGAE